MKELVRLQINNFNDRRVVMGILAANGYFVKQELIIKEFISTTDTYEIVILEKEK